jgi:hypothetical protein
MATEKAEAAVQRRAARAARAQRKAAAPRPREVAWEGWLAKLAAYKAAHGDCNVPKGSTGAKRERAEERETGLGALGNWVINQRKGKRKLDCGEPSQGMTAARAARLTALGFAWDRGGIVRGTGRRLKAAAAAAGPAAIEVVTNYFMATFL